MSSQSVIYCDGTEGFVQIIIMLMREGILFEASHFDLTITLKGF